jgi:hypothetical protein
MSNSLLSYNQNQDILDKDSTALPRTTTTKKEEDLISDNNYNENNINSQCIIDECFDLGENLMLLQKIIQITVFHTLYVIGINMNL